MTQDILERMRELTDPELALERKQRMDETVKYALDHLEEWRKAHPNCWTAVAGNSLVAAEASPEQLRESVSKKGINLTDVYIDFLSEVKSILVL